MDIKPVRKPPVPRPPAPVTPPASTPQPFAAIEEAPASGLNVKKKSPLKKVLLWSGLGVLVVLLATALASWLWYQAQLEPLGTDSNEHVKVTIEEGSTPSQIASLLEEKKVIRNSFAFGIYARFSGTQNQLQAGSYRLTPSESTPEIVSHLVSGKNVDTFDVTFLPGATLQQNRDVLLKAGYSEQEVDMGLSASYVSPLFAGKPASADLEGYIYGNTYKFGSGATVEEILQYTFDTYEAVIEENDLVAKFAAQGLDLFQGITLASIVQRESGGDDEAAIASVFYNRLAEGIELGSDVTYQYIADKTGVARDPGLDSPYNTRRYPGLPPGPIATPGLKALLGVANPADSDYYYFLSGDDNITYFGRTLEEHERNITDHCKEKCLIL
jgi:UPF0755 protein